MTKEQLAEWIHEGRKGVFGCGSGARFDGGHAGLWFERFGTVAAKPKKGGYELGSKSLDWAKDAADKYSRAAARREPALKAYHERIARLVQIMGGKSFNAGSSHEWTRFVTGMGSANPIENGFTWHRTLGVPYIPGSSVKGMALAWARDWDEARSKETLKRIFGPQLWDDEEDDESATAEMGSVIFLDALPVTPPELVAEVMTPHGKGSGAPEDAGSPNPIGFLAVKSGIFRFQVLPSTTCRRFSASATNAGLAAAEEAEEDVSQAITWIEDALKTIGAGAKTKAGYGRFTRVL